MPGSQTAPRPPWQIAPALLLAAVLAQAADGELLWSEEFDVDGPPDPRVWSHDLGASGWGNEELQEYTDAPANVRLNGGHLVITARATEGDGAPFTSARIRTQDKLLFRYGRIEARIRVPQMAAGLWPAFWTLGGDFATTGWPGCGELDILEMGHVDALAAGTVQQLVLSTAHWEHEGAYAGYGLKLDTGEDMADDFHTWTMDWTPQKVTTWVDGKKIWEMDISPGSCTDCSEFHQPHFIILNMAVGGRFTGRLSKDGITAPLPAELRVDWIRLYDNGHAELSGSSLENGPPPIGPGHSGSWYDPAQSGHGFSLEFGVGSDGQPLAVAYWYVYDALGRPLFLAGTGRPEGNVVELAFIAPEGMKFGEFDPGTVTRPAAGSGRLEFSDAGHAVFDYQPSPHSVTELGHAAIEGLELVRLFAIPAPARNQAEAN